jgi:nucleoside 2-deoxyribosyltransferase
MTKMSDVEKVCLFFQFNSKFYNRNRLEKMIKDATELAAKNLENIKIEYCRINIHPSHSITTEVIKFIESASFCVFELSDINPNVLFELGYTFSKGKGLAILRNKASKVPIPSDLSGLLILHYDDSISLENLALDLSLYIEEHIKEANKKKYAYLLKRIWSFEPNEQVIFVSGNLKNQYVVLPPDANALLEACLTVKTLYPDVKIERFYAIDLPVEFENSMSIVSVGGPSSNQVTRKFLDKVTFPWDYVRPSPTEKQVLVNKITHEKKARLLNDNGFVKKDFGFFVKIPNPGSENKNIILITAMTTEGVLGCAKMFSFEGEHSRTNATKLTEIVGESKYFAVMTETEVKHRQIISKPLGNEVYIYSSSTKEWLEK